MPTLKIFLQVLILLTSNFFLIVYIIFSFFYFSIFLEEQLDAIDELITDMDLTVPIEYDDFCDLSIYK